MPRFWRRPPADETRPLDVVRQIHIDRELARFAAMQPRTDTIRDCIDYWLDRRLAAKGGDR